jgi:DNA-directed RNA polymerase subunit omega
MPLDNITELKKRVPGGKYALARAVAERARQLQGGATPLTEVRAPNPLSVAIDEIVQGKISFEMDDSEEPKKEDSDEAQASETTAETEPSL